MGSNRRNNQIKGQYYPLIYQMIDSLAWHNLSGNSIMVFLQLMRKRTGYNDSDLSLTYKEMEGRISRATLRKCFIELVEKGFIDMMRQGGLEKQCNIYGISERWRYYGTDKFELKTLKKWNHGGFGEIWRNKKEKSEAGINFETV